MDGTEGLQRVRELGGFTAVQDPAEAEVAFMPRHALNTAGVNKILNIRDMVVFVKELS
jgi:two-component system chemotaxis response regulator CheB